MRLAPARLLALLVFTCALGAVSSTARAQQSTLTLRGNYWRDRNTRVLAPEALLRKELPATGTVVEAGYLLDAITSASASAGVAADQPFTELRNDLSFRIGQRLGLATISGRYRYSTESDYWSHTGGVGVVFDLLQKNLTIGMDYVYTRATVARRVSPTGYVWAHGNSEEESRLESHYAILNIAQVLARWAVVEGCYELMFLDGYQGNPYRTVRVSGSPVRETVPLERLRHSAAGTLRITPLHHRGVLEYLTIFAKLHFHTDTWKVTSWQPELRVHVALGPVELRGTVRYATQSAAAFFRSETGTPPVNTPGGNAEYAAPVTFAHCPAVQTSTGTAEQCATGDSKLSEFQSIYLEGRVLLDLRVLDRPSMPLGHWLGGGTLAVTAGRYLNNNFTKVQYGDAWVGGLELRLPL